MLSDIHHSSGDTGCHNSCGSSERIIGTNLVLRWVIGILVGYKCRGFPAIFYSITMPDENESDSEHRKELQAWFSRAGYWFGMLLTHPGIRNAPFTGPVLPPPNPAAPGSLPGHVPPFPPTLGYTLPTATPNATSGPNPAHYATHSPLFTTVNGACCTVQSFNTYLINDQMFPVSTCQSP